MAATSSQCAFALVAPLVAGGKVTSDDIVMLATDFGGHALNGLGTKVDTSVFGDQRPDVRNEEFLWGVFFDILEFKVREFLRVQKKNLLEIFIF